MYCVYITLLSFSCLEVISLAKTILAYRANDREVMSFGTNENVKVFSKGAGKRTDLWGVEVYSIILYVKYWTHCD